MLCLADIKTILIFLNVQWLLLQKQRIEIEAIWASQKQKYLSEMTMSILILGYIGAGLHSWFRIKVWANFTCLPTGNVTQLKSGWHRICCGFTVGLNYGLRFGDFVVILGSLAVPFSVNHLNLLCISFSMFSAVRYVLNTFFLNLNEQFYWYTFLV